MKKVIFILALSFLLVCPLFAERNMGFGIQGGIPTSVVFDYNANYKFNYKLGLGWNFVSKTMDISASGKYKFDPIGSTSEENRKMVVSTGPHVAVHFVNDFGFSFDWLGELSYSFPMGERQCSAFINAGPGVRFMVNDGSKFDFSASIGILMHRSK